MNIKAVIAACCVLAVSANVQANEKPEDLIKARQAAYAFIAWNMGRVRANTEPNAVYNKEDVIKAANAIQATANAGLGQLFAKGTEKGTGFRETRVKPEVFMPEHGAKLAEIAGNFNREANALAAVAAKGEKDAVRAQLGKLGETCKACHDNFRNK